MKSGENEMKKMNHIKILFCILLMILLGTVAGCKKNNPVADDLVQYVETDLKAILPKEQEAISNYNMVCEQTNKLSSKEVIQKFETSILPDYKEFLDNLKKLQPQTQEVRELKDIYVEGATLQYEAMNMIVEALKQQDSNKMKEADELIVKAKSKLQTYEVKLTRLAKDNEIGVTNTNSQVSTSQESNK